MPHSRRGAHLTPQEEFEERQEQEKRARVARFTQGALAIDRASGGLPQPPAMAHPDSLYAEPVPVPQASPQPSGDWLEEQFARLNQRFSE